jgi:RNA polymerase sporulation-specific sigma factor
MEQIQREPTLEEMASFMEIEKEELVLALEANAEVESLHKPLYQKDGNEIELLEKIEEIENHEEQVVNRLLLNQMLERLGREERRLIYLRYFENKTQSEIGRILGISQVQVSRTEKKILEKMRMFSETSTHNCNV